MPVFAHLIIKILLLVKINGRNELLFVDGQIQISLLNYLTKASSIFIRISLAMLFCCIELESQRKVRLMFFLVFVLNVLTALAGWTLLVALASLPLANLIVKIN